MKVIVIGGGASGMMAALTAAKSAENQVTVLERQNRVGKKLMATGNGRCNLTNRHAAAAHYHGSRPEFVESALRRLPVEKTLAFFRALGLLTVTEEDGKTYPLSDQANSVVDTLRFAMEQRGITVVTGCDVLAVSKKARGYEIKTTGEIYFADRLIVAAGGCAGKNLGGTRSGYKILESLGHTCTPLLPALVQIRTEPTCVRALKGVRADCTVTLKGPEGILEKCSGELQFTDFGVSGPVAFALSRAVSTGESGMVLLLDLLREYTEEQVLEHLRQRCVRFPGLKAEQLLTGMLNPRLGTVLLKFTGMDPAAPLGQLEEAALKKLSHDLKFFPLPVEGTLGMEHAQVTVGGVLTEQFRADTLESRKAPGVFACGEVLDVDGDCGGFNLQWAWASGYVAGMLGRIEDDDAANP